MSSLGVRCWSMTNRQQILGGSILGAAFLYAVSTFIVPLGVARAQTPFKEERCKPGDAWETSSKPLGVDMAGAWEPFAAVHTPAGVSVVYRRCK